MTLNLPISDEANDLLRRDPLALLVGMTLDQQIPLEKAFGSPYELAQRIGVERLDAAALAAFDPETLVQVFATPPALHRFPKAMAARVQEVCAVIVEEYDGDPERLWAEAATGKELVKRISALPGFGKQKSQIFAALLGKRFGVQPEGWREAAGDYGAEGSYRSVADIVDAESLVKVRAFKKEMKAAAKAK
ncbi:(Fe-S)-cluster assembly protein [Virgisporangium aliadipatigenens]|uniref:(Fe-S)-cluster assembly protein n=1 Tax=Virgisporangium aliadipatigenens TaxID=741659 RepID=A0A8J4DWL9_9ACTN|nr:HhH-GPD-type base excision DNA repair protein [Virgisporangium aliadipatigenens]GIJ52408.1 (Fe-S)-cluster assembly protein [Virgisporangium aliadipatigenens]